MKPSFSALFIMSAVSLVSACQNDVSDSSASKNLISPREVKSLDEGWQFAKIEEMPASIHQPGFVWESAQTVAVPHSWNRVGYYLDNSDAHEHTAENTDLYQGKGLYRYEFQADTEQSERQWLEFDAASRVAKVWVNGNYVGEHRGSFTRFRFDVTDFIHANQSNVLVVEVDNSKPTATSATGDTLPIAGDFFVHGGLYRPVRLITTDAVHIALNDFGGPGVYVSSEIKDNVAELKTRLMVSNQTEKAAQYTAHIALIDDQDQQVAEQSIIVRLPAASTESVAGGLTVNEPHLWQGTRDPYLYTLQVNLTDENGVVTDTVEQPVGLRSIDITADNQVLLNGEKILLKGTGYHQDREGKGWAVSAEDIEQDVQMLASMGANSIRLAHYPHGQTVHDLADKLGLILWDEIPLVSAWRYGEKNQQMNEALADNASLQLKEMVKQNYNHPSVAVWGIANEVDFGAVVPMFVQSEPGSNPDPLPLLNRLQKEVGDLDPTRHSTLANCCAGVPTWDQAKVPETSEITDTTGANRYYGWYYGKPEQLGENLDALHRDYPQQPFSVTEYGAGGAITFHSDNPLGGPVAATGRNQPEEYMNYVHEENWRVLKDRDYLWGTWIWNGFDFATTTRREGDSQDINTKGLITYDRSVRKDPYFFYQANWSEEPMVHITSQRYIRRAYQVTDVKVYSNADTVELSVNGESLGTLKDCEMHVCVWRDVMLKQGINDLIATGRGNREGSGYEVKSTANWLLASESVNRYFIDAGAIMAADSEAANFGSDNFFTGGQAATLDKAGGWGRPPVKAEIAKTADRDLLATYRAGEFSYVLPLKDGEYQVEILTVLPDDGKPRRFSVSQNGEAIFSDVGSADPALTAVARTAVINVEDGALTLNFTPQDGEAVLSALKVEPLQ